MTHRIRPTVFFARRNRWKSKRMRMLQKMSAMRAAKERKRLANPVEREPKFVTCYPLEIGVRDKLTGEVAWCDFKSVRDAAKRLAVVKKFYVSKK